MSTFGKESFLLKEGADPNVRMERGRIFAENTPFKNLNAIELAQYLSTEKDEDRAEVLQLLLP